MNILSQLFNMSGGEEEEHGYEAIIKALMKALTGIKVFTDRFPETSNL